MFLNASLAGHYDLHNFTKTRGTNLPANLSSRNCFPVPSQPQSVQNSRLRRAVFVFPLMGKVFGQKLLMGKVFGQTPPTPGGGLLWSLVRVKSRESDPSQTYVSPFRIPVSPMADPPCRSSRNLWKLPKCLKFYDFFKKFEVLKRSRAPVSIFGT